MWIASCAGKRGGCGASVRQPRQQEILTSSDLAFVLQEVVAGSQRRDILHCGADGSRACVIRTRHHRWTVDRKQVAAHHAIQILPKSVLGVERLRHANGYASQGILGAIERLSAKAQQASQGAALEAGFGECGNRSTVAVSDHDTLRILGRGRGGEPENLVAEHDRLTVANKYVVGAAVLLDDEPAYFLVERGHQRITLIAQVVRSLLLCAPALGRHDLLVEVGNLLGKAVDRGDAGGDLRVDVAAHL